MSLNNVRFTGYDAVGPGRGQGSGRGKGTGRGQGCNGSGKKDGTGPRSLTGNCPQTQGAQNPQQGNKFNSMA